VLKPPPGIVASASSATEPLYGLDSTNELR